MYSYLDPNGNTFWCAEDIGVNAIVPANWVTTGGWSVIPGTDNLAFDGTGNPGGGAQITLVTIAWKLYKFTFAATQRTGVKQYDVNIFGGSFINTIVIPINNIGVYEYYFIPNSASTLLVIDQVAPTTAADTVTIENLSFDLLNANLVNDRMRCASFIIKPCDGGPGGGGLQGDCGETEINNGLILCEQDDSWNCNLCGNDLPYFNPVVIGDPFMFQFQQWDTVNGQYPWTGTKGWGDIIEATVYSCCDDDFIIGDVLSFATNHFVGIYNTIGYNGLDNWTNIQQVELDLETIYNAGIAADPNWDGCFYIEFVYKDLAGDVINDFYTEPYKFVKCEDTILLEGVHDRKDCSGFWYFSSGRDAAPNNIWQGIGNLFKYRNVYRVQGSFEYTGFEINKEFVGVKQFTANTERQDVWLFRTNRIPNRVARLISNILSAKTVYIEGLDYIASGTYTKNNDTGNQWFLESQLKRVTCSQTTSCD